MIQYKIVCGASSLAATVVAATAILSTMQ